MSVNDLVKYIVEMYRLCIKIEVFCVVALYACHMGCTVNNYLILMYRLDSDSAHNVTFLVALVVRYGRQLVRCA